MSNDCNICSIEYVSVQIIYSFCDYIIVTAVGCSKTTVLGEGLFEVSRLFPHVTATCFPYTRSDLIAFKAD